MLAHVVTGALGVTALEGLDNTLVLYNRLPQGVPPNQRQTLGLKQNAGETPMHVGKQPVARKANDEAVKIKIGSRILAQIDLPSGQAEAFEIMCKLGQFLFAMVHSGELAPPDSQQ